MLNFAIPKFIWVIFNLAILYFFLKKYLFKRVTDFMEKRARSIQDDIENAQADKAGALELKKRYESQILSAKDEAERIIEEANKRAHMEYEQHVAQAKNEVALINAKAREEIENERVRAIKSARNEIVSIALSAASKIIEANMDTAENRKIVEQFIDEEGVA